MNTDTGTISTDRTLQLIADERRREILRYMIDADGNTVTVDDLVAVTAGTDTPEGTKQARIDMHHVHLPKLADSGLVDYDPERGVVRYRSAKPVERLLGFVSETLE